MIIRSLDGDNDWTFGRGLSNYRSGPDAIALNIKTRLKQWRGDCFYAVGEGVDYVNLMDFGTKELLDSDVLRIISQSFGVLKITDFSSTIEDERTYTVQATIETIYSQNVRIEI